ncbi:MAG: hypothetical protein ACRC6U_02030 [Fusobacteriaceae bacterium]
MPNFSNTEKHILELFKNEKKITLESGDYNIITVGKPFPSDGKGEAKTDAYIKLENHEGNVKELKISIKQKNADFLENKISLERAQGIFGKDASNIIRESLEKIKDEFNYPLVYVSKSKKTEAGSLTIGWKFELMNKLSGKKSSEILLSDKQKLDVYSGSNLSCEKKNCKLEGEIIKNSGVANFVLEVDPSNLPTTSKEVFDSLESVEKYVKDKKFYFSFKAVNYRTSKSKWDGNRPLAVYVDWTSENNIISSKIVTETPLEVKANEIGNKIKKILDELNIEQSNFKDIKNHIKDKSIIND